MQKRAAASITGGTWLAPIFIGSQVRPQTRHIAEKSRALWDTRTRALARLIHYSR